MSTITWLHLSDLHIRAGQLEAWNRDIVLRAMVGDVDKCVNDAGLSPDMILATGDFAYGGDAAEYELVGPFFDSLLSVTGLTKDRLFLVPGNHDVNRGMVSDGARAHAGSLTDSQAVARALVDTGDRRQLLRRLDNYGEFVRSYLGGHMPYDDENYSYVRSVVVAGHRVDILGLNSSWLAYGGPNDERRLAVGELQVRGAVEDCGDSTVRIALVHHPLGWLRQFDEDVCKALLLRNCGFVLMGHRHWASLGPVETPGGTAFFIGAGACYETRKHSNSYNWVRLDLDAQLGKVLLRAWSASEQGSWIADTRTYPEMLDGSALFRLDPYLVDRHPPVFFWRTPVHDSATPA